MLRKWKGHSGEQRLYRKKKEQEKNVNVYQVWLLPIFMKKLKTYI